jgi:hypothetical protein
MSTTTYQRIVNANGEPYAVLCLSPRATTEDIAKRYKQLVRVQRVRRQTRTDPRSLLGHRTRPP